MLGWKEIMDKSELCCEILNLMREQRHDFVNHFQVVLGYLQLKKTGLAAEYIKQKNAEMQQFGLQTKCTNPYLEALMLLALHKSRGMGVELSFQVGDNVAIEHHHSEAVIDQIFFITVLALQVLNRQRDEEKWIKISLEENKENISGKIILPSMLTQENSDCLFNRLKQENLTITMNIKGEKLPDQIVINFQISKNK
jgi:sensor histidine kinase regulating citrate/malate metabolism